MHGVNNANESVETIFHTTTSFLFSSFSRLSQSLLSLSLLFDLGSIVSFSSLLVSNSLFSLLSQSRLDLCHSCLNLFSRILFSPRSRLNLPLCLVLSRSCLYLRSFSLFLILLALVVSCSAWLSLSCLVSFVSISSLAFGLVSFSSQSLIFFSRFDSFLSQSPLFSLVLLISLVLVVSRSAWLPCLIWSRLVSFSLPSCSLRFDLFSRICSRLVSISSLSLLSC